MKRINKTKARKLYAQGKPIYIVACKVSVYHITNGWHLGFRVQKDEDMTLNLGEPVSFDKLVNSYEHYNCCHELGYYAAYYV